MPSLALDMRCYEPFEIGARLDMLLTYPRASPARMERLVQAACADQIAATIDAFPELPAELLAKYPAYGPRRVRVERKNIIALREDAHIVGTAILPFMKNAAIGETPLLPAAMTRMSIDQIIRYLWPRKAGEAEDVYADRLHDVERRRFRSHFPVCHLAAALQWVARERAAVGDLMSYDYQDIAFHRRWVAKANEMAGYIRATPPLALAASKLIDLVWIEN